MTPASSTMFRPLWLFFFLPWSVSLALIRSSIARRICSCAFLSVASVLAELLTPFLLGEGP
jgi:hypothetical protein